MRARIRRKMEANARRAKYRLHVSSTRITYGDLSTNAGIAYRYGVSGYAFADMVDAQQGKCPVCGTTMQGRVVVDHCHVTGDVRGVLHQRCNLAIGLLGDNPANLMRAAEYLKRK